MTLQKGSALDSSLGVRNTTESIASTESAESTTLLESFPPLALTRSHALKSPSLGREPVDPIGVPPAESSRRWWILSLSCLLLFGNYFAYDNPAALNTQLQKYLDMPYNDYQYLLSTLYSVYSLPNTVLPFFFGSLVDKFGPQIVLLGLSSCVCIGQTIFSIGVQSRRVWIMLVGRAIFGIGGESCGVAQASITTMQFKGHELAFALGLNLCIARFGSVVNTLITPWAEQRWGVPTAIWIGTLSCVASFMSAVVLVNVIDPPRRQHVLESTETTLTPLLATSSNTLHRTDSTNTADCASSRSSFARFPTQSSTQQQYPGPLRRGVSFSDSIHSTGHTGGHGKARMQSSLHIVTDQSYGGRRQDSLWQSWWKDLKVFPLTFWLVCALTVLLYGTVVPFNNIASDFLQSKWYPGNPRKATAVMGIPDTLGAVLVPGFGMLVDRYGSRASTLIASAFIMVIVHSTLGLTTLSPVFAFSLLGVAYSMYGVALWPSIACVVTNELHLGKAYGISSSFLNISLTLVPPIVATIRVVGNSFLPVEMFFISMGLCGMLVGFVLKNIDRRSGGALEQPEIRVEVPVLVPQANIPSTFVSDSAVASPVISQGRPAFTRRLQRPILNCIQSTGPILGLGLRRVESLSEECGPTLSQRSENPSPFQELDAVNHNELQTGNATSHQTAPRTSSSPETRRPLILPVSPMTERNRRRWFGERRPLLRRKLTSVESPLLQRYAGSPRYGSFSSPSLASVSAGDHAFYRGSEDIESRLPGSEAFVEDYSVSQHPILYNPLRGSSGSFRISRSARPVVFSESEEGLVYVDEQAAKGSGCDDEGDAMSGSKQQVHAGLQHITDIADDDDTESTTVTSSNNGDFKDTHVEIDARQYDKN